MKLFALLLNNSRNLFILYYLLHAESETWHLVSQGGAVDGPPPRHRHTAVLHDSAMWVFGGMTDLQVQL